MNLLIGSSCPMELKPPRIAAKSKKIYRGVFVRKKGNFHHVYALDGLYILSLHLSRDVFEWIDRNHEEITKRVGML